jgi:hypothetical protein
MRSISLSAFLVCCLLLFSLVYAIHIDGTSLNYFTGENVNGNLTIIPVENPENKTKTSFTNGQWSVDFDMIIEDVEYLTFIVDNNEKIGYIQVKLDNDNPKKITGCSYQNISVSGYSVDIDSGDSITSGNVKISILDTDYVNTASFSGEWNIDFHPCLTSGKIYTIYILISDNTGKNGEIFQTYPAR